MVSIPQSCTQSQAFGREFGESAIYTFLIPIHLHQAYPGYYKKKYYENIRNTKTIFSSSLKCQLFWVSTLFHCLIVDVHLFTSFVILYF